MLRDLDFGLELVVAPTVREPDGLALSSRNRYLSETERRRALVLSRALGASVALWDAGNRNPSEILASGLDVLGAEPPDRLDYFTLLDPDTLEVLDASTSRDEPCILVVAGRYGTTRLIDNAVLGRVWG
jgi:pantoate--beta-alanine ligase